MSSLTLSIFLLLPAAAAENKRCSYVARRKWPLGFHSSTTLCARTPSSTPPPFTTSIPSILVPPTSETPIGTTPLILTHSITSTIPILLSVNYTLLILLLNWFLSFYAYFLLLLCFLQDCINESYRSSLHIQDVGVEDDRSSLDDGESSRVGYNILTIDGTPVFSFWFYLIVDYDSSWKQKVILFS